ncbi:hypothetical protein [Tannerella sp.]|uniref:hypothetical protein n=1 Tax=Tannerella sp. TaxID=2382127 RepID=UPI0026DD0C4A|nr:hypothetical protein [Tannerella sp.]MDO4702431.1 hypothetical protein [Tannerella sp.]
MPGKDNRPYGNRPPRREVIIDLTEMFCRDGKRSSVLRESPAMPGKDNRPYGNRPPRREIIVDSTDISRRIGTSSRMVWSCPAEKKIFLIRPEQDAVMV